MFDLLDDTAEAVPVLTRADFAAHGIGDRALKALLAGGVVLALRAGRFVAAERFRALTPEQQMVVRAKALIAASAFRPVFCHDTAAAIWQLPLYRTDVERVHVVSPDPRSGAGKGVVRHRGGPGDIVEIDGMLVTSLERTLADMARTASTAAAVAVADAALRRVAVRGPSRYDADAADELRAAAAELALSVSFGSARARRVLAFADGRAQLPGESVSRLHIVRLGFATPRLQVHVPGPHGRDYYVDFGLDDVDAFGEFDGEGKYRDPVMLAGRTPQQALRDEKEREDWIRGTTRRPFARWGSRDIGTHLALGQKLAAFGIVPPQ